MAELIDLHTHSTASDGSFSPREVVELAKKQGLKALALTDHDTLSGLFEAEEKAKELDMEFVRGCELSAKFLDTDVHVLGLYLPKDNSLLEDLEKELDIFIERRNTRNKKIIQKLQEQGIDITLKDVEEEAGGKVVARPHFANVLLQKGAVTSIKEAFDKYLAKGKSAYVPREPITPEHAVEILTEAKAVPILAHPKLIKCSEQERITLIETLIPLGLKGIEVYHPVHSFEDERYYLELAHKYSLCISGGSDFHGKSKPDIQIGKGKGGLRVPACILDDIKKCRYQ